MSLNNLLMLWWSAHCCGQAREEKQIVPAVLWMSELCYICCNVTMETKQIGFFLLFIITLFEWKLYVFVWHPSCCWKKAASAWTSSRVSSPRCRYVRSDRSGAISGASLMKALTYRVVCEPPAPDRLMVGRHRSSPSINQAWAQVDNVLLEPRLQTNNKVFPQAPLSGRKAKTLTRWKEVLPRDINL